MLILLYRADFDYRIEREFSKEVLNSMFLGYFLRLLSQKCTDFNFCLIGHLEVVS